MNVLSLFDGISACRLALERAGFDVDTYYTAEVDKYATRISDYHYPDSIRLGDVTNWESWDIDWSSIDLVTGGFPCFLAGTLVTTSDGLKPIETIKEGDLVITHNHRFKPVVTPMVKIADHFNLVKIQGSHELKVTDEHPFYVREVSRPWNNELRRNFRTFSDPKWVSCKDLNNNHFVGVPLNQNSITPNFSDNTDFWYVVGRYVADGYSSTTNKHSRGFNNSTRRVYKTIITCGKHEEAFVDSIFDKIEYTATKSLEKTSIKYTISNKNLWTFIQKFGRGAENKEIPNELFDAPIKIIKSFLDGYLSGDGCYINSKNNKGSKKLSQFTTVSEKLAYGIIQLVQKAYKVQPNISKSNVASKKIIEGREVNQKPFFTVRFHKEKTKFVKFFEEDGFLWTPFKSKIRVEETRPVYNFEVEDDNSYAVNNLIVHNCQAWSMAGKRMGDKDPRGMLFWTMLDIMKTVLWHNSKAVFLIENVKMKQEFEAYITLHTEQALGEVSKHLINSALVSAQNRQRYYWTNIQGIVQPEDKGLVLGDVIEKSKTRHKVLRPASITGRRLNERGVRDDCNKGVPVTQCLEVKHDNSKTGCLTTVEKDTLLSDMPPARYPNAYTDKNLSYRKLTILERERLQTFPDDWTLVTDDDGNRLVSNTQRSKALGNAWTVDVIAHILSFIKQETEA